MNESENTVAYMLCSRQLAQLSILQPWETPCIPCGTDRDKPEGFPWSCCSECEELGPQTSMMPPLKGAELLRVKERGQWPRPWLTVTGRMNVQEEQCTENEGYSKIMVTRCQRGEREWGCPDSMCETVRIGNVDWYIWGQKLSVRIQNRIGENRMMTWTDVCLNSWF